MNRHKIFKLMLAVLYLLLICSIFIPYFKLFNNFDYIKFTSKLGRLSDSIFIYAFFLVPVIVGILNFCFNVFVDRLWATILSFIINLGFTAYYGYALASDLKSFISAANTGLYYVPLLGTIIALFSFLHLFSFQKGKQTQKVVTNSNQSQIYHYLQGLTGTYASAHIPVSADILSLGRDPEQCSLVVNGPKVSRKHCDIHFDNSISQYIIKDFSSNGTFTADGRRLISNMENAIPVGTVIYIGNSENSFTLY